MGLNEKLITLNQYQAVACSTFITTEDEEIDAAHVGFGLLAEAGEIATLYQKMYRGDPAYKADNYESYTLTDEKKKLLKKELGDVLWHIGTLAGIYG